MTREQYLIELENVVQNCDFTARLSSGIDIKIYTGMLEQRIKQLEAPKECCKCIEANQMDMAHYNCTYFGKVKAKHYCSFYEPKETNDQDN